MSGLDLMADHEAISYLERRYPSWMVFRQGKGLWLNSCFARNRDSGDQVEAEDWTDLRDQLTRETGRTS
jgi:hypothetical protein